MQRKSFRKQQHTVCLCVHTIRQVKLLHWIAGDMVSVRCRFWTFENLNNGFNKWLFVYLIILKNEHYQKHIYMLRLSTSNGRNGQNSLTWHNLLSHINSTGTFTRSLGKHFDCCETWFCCFAVAVAAIAAPVSSYPLHSTRNKNDSNYRDWGLREGRREGQSIAQRTIRETSGRTMSMIFTRRMNA